MTTSDLGRDILKSVSRSFYLSIRILPEGVRAPVALAYLLARASDTMADCESLPVNVRVHALETFDAIISGDAGPDAMGTIQAQIRSPHSGEQALIDRLPDCMQWLAQLATGDRTEILRVLPIIIQGQRLDLERFTSGSSIQALDSADALDDYTYRVAGCVGEFWTRVCLRHVPNYSEMDTEKLCTLGRDFGKALQLVNILRDMPADLRAGRCYLPEPELTAIGLTPETLLANPAKARPATDKWLAQASQYLQSGTCYIQAVRSPRIRMACFLPWYLGIKTIAMMRATPPLEATAKVKVPRKTVYRAMLKAIPCAFSNARLQACATELP